MDNKNNGNETRTWMQWVREMGLKINEAFKALDEKLGGSSNITDEEAIRAYLDEQGRVKETSAKQTVQMAEPENAFLAESARAISELWVKEAQSKDLRKVHGSIEYRARAMERHERHHGQPAKREETER